MEKLLSMFDNKYSVFENGKIFSYKSNKFMKPFDQGSGYLKVNLTHKGKKYSKYVHRLVADAFCVQRSGDTDVNHKDGNKKNNKASNLEWCTRSYNIKHSWDNKIRTANYRLTKNEMTAVKLLKKEGYTFRQLSKFFKVSQGCISNVVYNKNKSSGGIDNA